MKVKAGGGPALPHDKTLGPLTDAQTVLKDATGSPRETSQPDEIAQIDRVAKGRGGTHGTEGSKRWSFADGSYIVN